VRIDNADADDASFMVPYDSQANEFHIILTVRDNGSPNLFAYRRVIVQSPAAVDESPPSAPIRVRAVVTGETQVNLRWRAAKDAESGIRRYVIYRDRERIAESRSNHFVDNGLCESTEYTYQVAALNGCLTEGAKSSSVRTITNPDQTPPAIKTAAGSDEKIRVIFSEPVERASAENVSNYTVDGDISINAAALTNDQQSVILTPSDMIDGTKYMLFVKNIKDRAKVPNTLVPGVTPFTYRTIAPLVCVGITDNESPVKFHGRVKREKDGSLFFADGEPWSWVTVGKDEKPLDALEGLQSFTILGWARATNLRTGSGGNRFVFNLNRNRSGMDLVHHEDGRLRLAVNEWPDGVNNDSSPSMIKVGKWIFFAVTYDSSKKQNNVQWYFGDKATLAQLDRTTSYSRGPTGTDSRELTVGNYNTTLHGAGKNRQFRGWLRGITIFGSHWDASGVLELDSIRLYQDALSPDIP